MAMDLEGVWAERLDKFCLIIASLVPMGLVVGNVGFESLIGLVGFGWIIRCLIAGQHPFRKSDSSAFMVPWVVWYLSIVVSLLVNGPGSKGWAHDVVFVRYVLFGIALLDMSRRQPVSRYLLYGLAAGVIWAALNTLSAYLLGYDFLGKPLIRYTYKLKEASRIAGMDAYAAAFFLAWGMLDEKLSKKNKIIIIVLGLLASVQLFQVHVRTAVVAAAAGVFFGVSVFIRRRVAPWVAAGFLTSVLLAVGLFFHFSRMWDLHSIYDRVYYWKVAWRMWIDNPLFGVGISSFQDAYKEMALSGKVTAFIAPNQEVFRLSEVTHAHNLILMLAASTGLFGVGSFLWLLVEGVRRIFKRLRGFRLGLVTWPVVLLVIGLTGFNIYHSWYQALLAFWLILIGVGDATDRDESYRGFL